MPSAAAVTTANAIIVKPRKASADKRLAIVDVGMVALAETIVSVIHRKQSPHLMSKLLAPGDALAALSVNAVTTASAQRFDSH